MLLNDKSNLFKIQRSPNTNFRMEKSCFFTSIYTNCEWLHFFIFIPFIFNVIFLKEEILLHLWRYPSLSIHGIEGAFHEPGIKTVIPAKVIGKFSIRQVPHMDLSLVKQQVRVKPFLWPLLRKLSPS